MYLVLLSGGSGKRLEYEVLIKMNNRIPQLDSIRGLASLSVFVHHIYLVTPILPLLFWQSPLRIFINGRGAVLLFFVLSGLVLSLPFFNGKKIPYISFMTKRIIRIYIPYAIAILINIIACSVLYTDKTISEGWLNNFWKTKPNMNSILEHLNLLGDMHTSYFNTVIWSLIHEMRISLVFPVILILVKKLNLLPNLIICASLSFTAWLNGIFHFHHNVGFNTSYFDTLHYLSVFILGALLSKHKNDITLIYNRISTKVKWILLCSSLVIYAYSAALDAFINFPLNDKVADYGMILAAVAFVIFAINSIKLSALIVNKPTMFLGKISYSLYLYHMTVLQSFFYIFHGVFPVWIINILVFISGITFAYVFWYLIEKNTINLARNAGSKKIVTKHVFERPV
jgi:peptidoglycan/LPS O-acetylase OafA/YrhL